MHVIFIVGPTGSGKTAFAIDLATVLKAPIISADSRQVFKELNIGVARPSEKELLAAPHFFIASKSVVEPFSAGDFAQEANALLNALAQKGTEFAIVCGGSGLYIEALFNGLDDFDSTKGIFRNDLMHQLQTDGLNVLYKKLSELDPIYAASVDKFNPQRVVRALEVILETNKPFSDFRKGTPKTFPFSSSWYAINLDRKLLYDRLNVRVDKMLAAGLLEEAKVCLPFRSQKALETVGYKELFAYFDGLLSLGSAIEQIKQNTRRYAKRQITWFKRYPNLHWIEENQINQIVNAYAAKKIFR